MGMWDGVLGAWCRGRGCLPCAGGVVQGMAGYFGEGTCVGCLVNELSRKADGPRMHTEWGQARVCVLALPGSFKSLYP